MAEDYRPSTATGRLIRGRVTPAANAPFPTYRAFVPSAEPSPTPVAKNRHEPLKLIAYALAMVVISALTEPISLALAFCAVAWLGGRDTPALLRRALLATLAFSLTVSLSYAALVAWQSGIIPWSWLLSTNLRVLVMALLSFVFIRRTNLFAALGFSRRLSFMLVLAVSQSLGLRRTLDDFRQAMQSRGLRRAGLRDRYRAAAHAAGWLLDRALANAHESAQALQSRGLFK